MHFFYFHRPRPFTSLHPQAQYRIIYYCVRASLQDLFEHASNHLYINVPPATTTAVRDLGPYPSSHSSAVARSSLPLTAGSTDLGANTIAVERTHKPNDIGAPRTGAAMLSTFKDQGFPSAYAPRTTESDFQAVGSGPSVVTANEYRMHPGTSNASANDFMQTGNDSHDGAMVTIRAIDLRALQEEVQQSRETMAEMLASLLRMRAQFNNDIDSLINKLRMPLPQ